MGALVMKLFDQDGKLDEDVQDALYELGNVGVSMDLIFKMCEVFKIKPKDLFDFRD